MPLFYEIPPEVLAGLAALPSESHGAGLMRVNGDKATYIVEGEHGQAGTELATVLEDARSSVPLSDWSASETPRVMRRVTPPRQAGEGEGEGRILVPASDVSQSQSQSEAAKLGGFLVSVSGSGEAWLGFEELDGMLSRIS
jgi:hypothetical protein